MSIVAELGFTPGRVALRRLLEVPGVNGLILGARKVSQLEDNIGCMDIELSDEHIHSLSVYDIFYLKLAMREGIPIATHDKTLRQACRHIGVVLFEPNRS